MQQNSTMPPRIRFDRNEFAGSFGDIGTDLPLIVGMVLAAGLDAASVFITFGVAQIATGLIYGLPMPMQPLKAMAVLVISQKLSGDILYGGGLAIGAVMLLLTVSGGLTLLARLVPRCVVRGIQFGLGLSLASRERSRGGPGRMEESAHWGSHRSPSGRARRGWPARRGPDRTARLARRPHSSFDRPSPVIPISYAPAAARLSSRMDSARTTSSAVVTSGGMIRITLT